MLFTHITSQVPGEKYPRLLQEMGGSGFPFLAFLSEEGKLLAAHMSANRTVSGLEDTAYEVNRFVELKKAVEGGDASAAVDFFLLRMKLGHLSWEEAKSIHGKLGNVTPDQGKRIQARMLDLEVMDALQQVQAAPERMNEFGKKWSATCEKGLFPKAENACQFYCMFIMQHAEFDGNARLYEKAYSELKRRFDKMPGFREFVQQNGFERKLKELQREG